MSCRENLPFIYIYIYIIRLTRIEFKHNYMNFINKSNLYPYVKFTSKNSSKRSKLASCDARIS